MGNPDGPAAVEEVAQSRGGQADAPEPAPTRPEPDEGVLYRISERLDRAAYTQLHERQSGEPTYRPLRIFALDPAISRLDGGLASTKVQYEPLRPGPIGSVIEVSNLDESGRSWRVADLEDPKILIKGGYTASISDPRFHQQMVYAVAMMTYDTFKVALGRNVAWAFPRIGADKHNRLLLRPHGTEKPNAWYDRNAGEIVFGYFKAMESTPVSHKDNSYVFTAISHDIIAHEMSHALLDGLRSNFLVPTHQDVLAFHEAFADLVACFQHFTFEDVVRASLVKSRGALGSAEMLTSIAREFGQGLGPGNKALRTLVDQGNKKKALTYDKAGREPHQLGKVLAQAVFGAFVVIFERRSRRFIKLATGGAGELPPGDLPEGLQDFLVAELRRLASQFLSICIRAVDYCPPVDVRFGDYLRALITADKDLVPEDDLAYREAIIQAFGARGIYGQGTLSMTEDALAWNGPLMTIEPEDALSFGEMRFEGDPARPVSPAEMRKQAGALGRLANRPEVAEDFGLVGPTHPKFRTGEYGLPIVESIRSARRVGPDQQVAFDTVGEIVQCRDVTDGEGRTFRFWGGATVIIGPRGDIRYVIRKRIDNDDRLNDQKEFMASPDGAALWESRSGMVRPANDISRRLCVHARDGAASGSKA